MSKNQEFNHIGEDIRSALEDAMASMDFTGLNDVISSTVSSAVGEFRKQFTIDTTAHREWSWKQQEERTRTQDEWEEKKKKPRESKTTALQTVKQRQVGQVSGVLYTVFGGIGVGIGGVLALVFGLLAEFVTTRFIPIFSVGVILVMVSIGMLTVGSIQRKRLERFRRYLKLCGDKMYCDIKQLSAHVGMNYKYVVKDLKKMLQLNMLPEGHLDEKATCLMLDDATYMQYLETNRG